jgi:hypothetical protein
VPGTTADAVRLRACVPARHVLVRTVLTMRMCWGQPVVGLSDLSAPVPVPVPVPLPGPAPLVVRGPCVLPCSCVDAEMGMAAVCAACDVTHAAGRGDAGRAGTVPAVAAAQDDRVQGLVPTAAAADTHRASRAVRPSARRPAAQEWRPGRVRPHAQRRTLLRTRYSHRPPLRLWILGCTCLFRLYVQACVCVFVFVHVRVRMYVCVCVCGSMGPTFAVVAVLGAPASC